MIHLTFPDGAAREFAAGITGLDIAEGHLASRSPSAPSRWRSTAGSPTSPTRSTQDAKIEFVTRDDPRALELIRHDCRACAGRGGAGAVARHAGDHRPGDRERLLLRLRPQRAVHARRLRRRSRRRCARSSRATGPSPRRSGARDKAKQVFARQGRDVQGRAGRRHPRGRGPQDLQAGRLVRPLPRPAHDLDRQDRQRLQADEGRRRLLARRSATTRC